MKMFDNSNTRIFLQGNEDVARWHLPVVLSRFKAFVSRCKNSGLKQDRFTMTFEEDGTVVFGQYFYGEESIQIYSPVRTIVIEEKSKDDLSVETKPKTFWVNTARGYFWVEVRYADGVPSVILTPFIAKVGDDWVYPGFALTAPGMMAGCFGDVAAGRYVLAQNGGIMTGEGENKGTINSTAIIAQDARISIVGEHDYVLIKSELGHTAEVRRITLTGSVESFDIERQYATIDMEYEGEASLSTAIMRPNPAWVHRKCAGSYFSPNKTIGYHVDIGTDDEYLGNLLGVRGADLLDNTGGYPEAMFNHTPDLYRIAALCCFPVRVSGARLTLLMVSPTMGYVNDQHNSQKCWGGYAVIQDWATCADYQRDFDFWLLAPRIIEVTVNMATGERDFFDQSIGASSSDRHEMLSWDGKFFAAVHYETRFDCGTVYYREDGKTQADEQCSWTQEYVHHCGGSDPGSTGEGAYAWTPYTHLRYFSREDLKNTKHFSFVLGGHPPVLSAPSHINGYYFLFNGHWHLDVGVIWANSEVLGNICGLCSYPQRYQAPGENIIFYYEGTLSPSWILENGSEYVKNLEVVTPLGYIPGPSGGIVFGFVAKVPEEYEAPHDPVVVTGGIKFKSFFTEGDTIFCERSLLTSPCECEGNELVMDETYTQFNLGETGYVITSGGCAPFEWSLQGANVDGMSRIVTDQHTLSVSVEDGCEARVFIRDACGRSVETSDAYSIVGAVSGESSLEPGESAAYVHNLEDAVYTGELILVEEIVGGAILQMPENATGGAAYLVEWEGRCGSSASKSVTAGYPCLVYIDAIDPLDAATHPVVGQWVALQPDGTSDCWAQVTGVSISTGYTTYELCPGGNCVLVPTCNWAGQVVSVIDVYKYIGPGYAGAEETHFEYERTRVHLGNLTFEDPC